MPSIFEQLGGLATGVASLAIVLVVAFLIMAQGKTQTGRLKDLILQMLLSVKPVLLVMLQILYN